MTAEQIDFVKRAYWLLANGLDDEEMIMAGAAICAGIVEQNTDVKTAEDIRDRIIMYCRSTIAAFKSAQEETDHGI